MSPCVIARSSKRDQILLLVAVVVLLLLFLVNKGEVARSRHREKL